ncbi:hypothetical protein LOAG_10907 [Loa loa]|nr:hypothetical protein LOAG_10907 [Loa loa]EFO17592.1 hypothetical protein LOAG_10907 [Loa loa]
MTTGLPQQRLAAYVGGTPPGISEIELKNSNQHRSKKPEITKLLTSLSQELRQKKGNPMDRASNCGMFYAPTLIREMYKRVQEKTAALKLGGMRPTGSTEIPKKESREEIRRSMMGK